MKEVKVGLVDKKLEGQDQLELAEFLANNKNMAGHRLEKILV